MKKFIEIPFGAKDSELGGWEYNIPEGYAASIENGKIVVKKEELDDEKIKKAINDVIHLDNNEIRSILDLHNISYQDAWDWLEKQDEQEEPQIYETEGGEVITYSESEGYKIVGPKFKQGEWIVWKDKYYKVNCNGCGYELFDQNGLSTSWEYKTIEDNAHLWTIQDAKDGDVLYFDGGTIVIFKDLYNSSTFHSYCHIEDDKFDISEDSLPDWWEADGFYPATKEQRELLFQKMKEAGYEWDAEKKELKKIEHKPTWNEEDEENLNKLHKLIVKKAYEEYEIDTEDETLYGKWLKLDNWLKSFKERIKGE